MKNAQRNSFKFNPIAAAVAVAMTCQFSGNVAQAGAGFGQGPVRTYYANSPAGPALQLDLTTGAPTIRGDGSGLPVVNDTGKALRKFVDTLPGIPGITPASVGVNNLGQYIPLAVAEKWVDLNGTTTTDDYYEIAAVEFSEKMHSDLPKATRLRGYVQLSTVKNPGKKIPLTYPGGAAVLDTRGLQVYAYDNPHHLGPIIKSAKGTAVRVKFTNYLPIGTGGELFIPVDSTITGAGTGPNGAAYTQNRASIRLVGGQTPWISGGSPHQWVAPAGEAAAYTAGLGKGASAQNVPDMADPGPGSSTLYFPNDMSARFMFYQDRTSGLTRLNSYAGLEAGYLVTDPAEAALIASGAVPADQIPLIIEDKTFVPSNIAQQDAKWDTAHWGQPGDLWFPHVYEPNQDPASIDGTNPAGRWDYGPWFWPIFPAKNPLPTGGYGAASFTPEAYLDTPVINGTAYPTLTVSPKAYRFRILNASNDRYINLGLFKADGTVRAPQLDQNGNPIVDANGNQQFFRDTEVKMVAAVGDAAGNPVGWDAVNGVQLPLPKYPGLRTNINVASSGPSRAWPVDNRVGGAPDPTTAGPDFIVIGNDGGLLPNPVDVPAQPVTYEANRRSITVGNIYGYGLLLGPAERADAIVDFSQYAGQTLILYNDAPAPTPFMDTRNDYFTGGPDQSAFGGAYTTQPGYGPNTRTMMQIKVSNGGAAPAFNPAALVTALPAAYKASQLNPIVPAVAYNAAFGTNDPDIYAHVATGSSVQPKLEYSTSGSMTLTGLSLITSGGTVQPGGAIVGNANPGSGTGYDPSSPPLVVFNNTVNGISCLSPAGGRSAAATVSVDPTSRQVYLSPTDIANFDPGAGYTCAPIVTFTPTSPISNVVFLQSGGTGYSAPVVSITGGGGSGATANAVVSFPIASVSMATNGSGYTAPLVTVSGGGIAAGSVTGTATVGTSPVSTITLSNAGTGYASAPTVTIAGGGGSGAVATAAIAFPIANNISVGNGGTGYTAPIVTFVTPADGNGAGATATATVSTSALSAVNLSSPGSGYTSAPTVTIDPPAGSGVRATATAIFDGLANAVTGFTVTDAGSGYTSAPTVTIDPPAGSGVRATATATLAPGAGVVTGITVTNTGAGYTTAPTINIVDTTGTGTGAAATATLAATGSVKDITVTNSGSGFVSAPTISFSGGGGTGALATATVLAPAGQITGVSLTPASAIFTAAPTITITDNSGTGASAIATLASAGTVTAINVTNTGKGFSSTPTITITGAGGTGAAAKAILSTPVGIGAQAVVTTNQFNSFDVLAKAEQELFDASGRYNSTGGVEIPWTNGLVQTTVPLNYIDSATEIIADSRFVNGILVNNSVQIWKLVDNGFWSNSIHFDMMDVQLINRVGWDGTVKPPASNEVGWKDTVRLNPLEDVIVAMRSKRPNISFGLPRSNRLLDPSKPLDTSGAAASGLGFTVAAGITPPLATKNTQADFDNEFTWGSAILGHAENDFTRPVVFRPTVRPPVAPSGLADPLGSGTLTWIDPTPVGGVDANGIATLANPENEIGFKILSASVTNGNTGTLSPVLVAGIPVTVPANVTRWTVPVLVPDVVYAVVAYNAAGDSPPSAIYSPLPPIAPTTFDAGAVVFNSVTLIWSGAANANQLEVWRAVGAGAAVRIATVAGSATTYVDKSVTALMSYTYQIKAVNALAPIPAGAALSTLLTVNTPMEFVAAPTALKATLNAARTSVSLSWTDAANNETAYLVEVSTNGGASFTALPLIARTAAQKTATGQTVTTNITTTPSSGYTFRVTAINVTGAATSTSVAVTVDVPAPPAPAAPAAPANLAASVTTNNGAVVVRLSWSAVAPVAGVTMSYVVNINGGLVPVSVPVTGTTFNPTSAQMPAGRIYTVSVVALASRFGLTSTSVPATVSVDLTAPLAPTAVSTVAGAAGSRQITVNWTDASYNETGFTIQRATVTGGVVGTYANAGNVAAGVQTFRDTNNLTSGRSYQYQVRANGVAGNSAYTVASTSPVVAP